jgi:hypothetical protein
LSTGSIGREMLQANSALEQTASAARPWQRAQGKTVARGGPRPARRPPLLTAGVGRNLGRSATRSAISNRRCIVAVALAVFALPTVSVAGEGCLDSVPFYLSVLERRAPEGMSAAMSCLQCRTEHSWKWAGPIAAAQFEECRQAQIRQRLTAACTPLISDSTYQDYGNFVTRYRVAALLASYGIGRVDGEDIFRILAVEKHRRFEFEPIDYMALAILQDRRTLSFLASDYASLSKIDSRRRTDRVIAILNCLYHVPGDSALVLARTIGQQEGADLIGKRVSRVLAR